MNQIKKCSTCNIHQPTNNFYRDKTYRDGYKNQCKSCQKIRKRKVYKYQNNKLQSDSSQLELFKTKRQFAHETNIDKLLELHEKIGKILEYIKEQESQKDNGIIIEKPPISMEDLDDSSMFINKPEHIQGCVWFKLREIKIFVDQSEIDVVETKTSWVVNCVKFAELTPEQRTTIIKSVQEC